MVGNRKDSETRGPQCPTAKVAMDTSTQIALFNDIFTGIYVVLTLVIVIFTYQSLKITRKALEANRQQSIEAIAAVNKQILASEQQAKEALQNQHRPVIVPTRAMFRLNQQSSDRLKFTMQNKGYGTALNTWGVVIHKRIDDFYRFENTYFLVPDKPEDIDLLSIKNSLDFMFPDKKFNGISIYPEPDSNQEDGARLLVTYNDIFDNRYLVIFDTSSLFGWRQTGEPIKINRNCSGGVA